GGHGLRGGSLRRHHHLAGRRGGGPGGGLAPARRPATADRTHRPAARPLRDRPARRGAGSGVSDLCAVVLAAGEGTRLRPLTLARPKALCPVGNVPLLDRTLTHLAGLGLSGPAVVAANASWLAEQVVAHAGGRVHVSVEARPLGTAGGLARLRDWVAGRAVLVGNADAYLAGGSLAALLADWDGATVRLLGVPVPPGTAGTFSGYGFAGFSLLPWRWVRDLPSEGELVRAV